MRIPLMKNVGVPVIWSFWPSCASARTSSSVSSYRASKSVTWSHLGERLLHAVACQRFLVGEQPFLHLLGPIPLTREAHGDRGLTGRGVDAAHVAFRLERIVQADERHLPRKLLLVFLS